MSGASGASLAPHRPPGLARRGVAMDAPTERKIGLLGHNNGSDCQELMFMTTIEPSKKAPAFSLKDQDGTIRRLRDYAGRPLVLYFYPKDDTSGCTKEACAFRDNLPKFAASKAAVLGVSILDEA